MTDFSIFHDEDKAATMRRLGIKYCHAVIYDEMTPFAHDCY